MAFLYTLGFFLVPAGMLYLAHHQRWAKKMGVILLCYMGGLLLGNFGLIPQAASRVQVSLSEITVALALPLLLCTLDIRQWRKTAGRAILSMLFATTSVVAVATMLFYLYRDDGVQASSNLAAMAVGVYTGGTPNLAAIKSALEIPHSQYIMFHTLDTAAGGLYILFMLTIGIPLFRRLLGRPAVVEGAEGVQVKLLDEEDYAPLFRRDSLAQLVKIAALSVSVFLLAMALSQLTRMVFSLQGTSALTILFLTTLGMSLSFSERVRELIFSYRVGMYLIYVFCFTVATMASLEEFARVSFSVAVFVFSTIAGSLALHLLLCKLAGVDGDTFMVTSVAAICSPPFVPLLVKSMANPGMLLSGMTTGIIGYALGNYLGISLALFLQS